MQHPHRRWEGFRRIIWVNGLPKPERARGQEPADKAENGEKTLKLLLGETRDEYGHSCNCLKSNANRSMEGLWLQRLRARWTRRTGKRTACATSASPAPPERGRGRHEWTAYLTLIRAVWRNCGMAYGARASWSRSFRSSRRTGKPSTRGIEPHGEGKQASLQGGGTGRCDT